jgi:DNA-binding NarL/FixJ family response regulator
MLRLMKPLDGSATADPLQRNRQLLADLCRLIGSQVNGTPANRHAATTRNSIPLPDPLEVLLKGQLLSPRMEQTLRSLLGGASEKQVAAKLGVSPHTVHVYVKALYKKYGVCSRGELLAKWVQASSAT